MISRVTHPPFATIACYWSRLREYLPPLLACNCARTWHCSSPWVYWRAVGGSGNPPPMPVMHIPAICNHTCVSPACFEPSVLTGQNSIPDACPSACRCFHFTPPTLSSAATTCPLIQPYQSHHHTNALFSRRKMPQSQRFPSVIAQLYLAHA